MNRRTFIAVPLLLASLFLIPIRSQAEPTLLLREPAISHDHVAFVYAGDLWVANRDGSNPHRITVNPGNENHPYFSPDGQWIAFTGQYDGNTDVYIVSVNGGDPVRLTFHPESDNVCGWTPDGSAVLFRSPRSTFRGRFDQLFTVPTSGGLPQQLILPRGERACYSPDGSKIAYTFARDAFAWWRRYRGGRNTFIWIFDFATHDVEQIPQAAVWNDTYPVWMGGTVYFLSDRDLTMNIYAYDTATKETRQLTSYTDFDVKTLKAGDGTLVYEQAGRVHELNPADGSDKVLPIRVSPDLPSARPHFEDVSKSIRWYELSPTGQRALFGTRGDVWTVPAEKGDARNLTKSSNAYERYPVWSPDGKTIAYLSDESGEYQLELADQKGQGAPRTISLGDPDFYYDPIWAPDGKSMLIRDNGLSLFQIDMKSGKKTLIDKDSQSSDNFTPSWSPDSRWIAYCKELPNEYRAVFLYDTKSETSTQITDGRSDAVSPVFSRDGKYLYFAASTNFALNVSDLDMSSYDKPIVRSLYVAVLAKSTANPFAPESDEEPAEKEKKEKKEKEEEKVETTVDFEGLDQRILALPVDEGDFETLQPADGGYLFYLSTDLDDKTTLMRFDMGERESTSFLEDVTGYVVSADGKKLLYSYSGGYGIVEASGSPGTGDGALDLSQMKAWVIPRAEWAQMFHEAWRLERDFFYDPGMHGADWPALYKKYQPFVGFIGHRSDLNYLIGQMIGELTVGHVYVWGGDDPDVPSVSVGLLGADYEIADGRYRFKKVFSGLNWNPETRAPLTEPGVDVHAGEYLLAVNGKVLDSSQNVYAFFQNEADRQVTLTVGPRADGKDSRDVIVKPVSSERNLRLRDWVEANRRKVDEATGGRVAYVYLPDTGGSGYEFFNRYYYSQLDKEAALIDERFNGGGSVADYMIDMMNRPLLNWWITRNHTYYSSPRASIYGPKVMLINEESGSGGDWLPMAFRERGFGPLIGTRTWGGLVGISAVPDLMDGGTVTVSSFGVFGLDGKWIVENKGIPPDIEVKQLPKEVIAGHDPQLEKGIETILEELKDYQKPEPKLKPFPKRVQDPNDR